MDRNSRAILAKGIKLDKQYKNIVDYTETQMVNLCLANKVYESNTCSIIKNNESIELDVTFTVALQANYIAFENPNYGNKWFFAFIDRVEYISDNATRIYFSIDELSTWRDYWDIKTTFVVREHVNDDTIGLHTIPEDLECGDYYIASNTPISITNESTGYFMCVFMVTNPPYDNAPVTYIQHAIGNVFSGLLTFATTISDAPKIIELYEKSSATTSDSIVNIYMCPVEMVNTNLHSTWTIDGVSADIYNINSSTQTLNTKTISETLTFQGFTPKNKKLACYPFKYFHVTNNAGTDIEYRWEDVGKNLSGIPTATFNVSGIATCGCSIRLFLKEYKNYTYSESPLVEGTDLFAYGIQGAKVPVCAWLKDYYTNWLTQNGVNHGVRLGLAVAGGVAGIASGNPIIGALSFGSTINSLVAESQKASKVPPQAEGDLNTSDLLFSNQFNMFNVYSMELRREYAEIIDNFFNLKGYKINSVKVPNETGRAYWNYVQIASESVIGTTKNTISVPTSSMDVINNAYRAGVTIWHDHANIGNYSLNNTIVTPTP